MYNFKRLIKKYSKTKPSLKKTTEGYRDYDKGGIWVDGLVTFEEFEGAVLPLGEKLIIDNSGYTTDDKKLYTYHNVEENQTIVFKGNEYTTMEYKGYEDYDIGLKVFILKRGGKDD